MSKQQHTCTGLCLAEIESWLTASLATGALRTTSGQGRWHACLYLYLYISIYIYAVTKLHGLHAKRTSSSRHVGCAAPRKRAAQPRSSAPQVLETHGCRIPHPSASAAQWTSTRSRCPAARHKRDLGKAMQTLLIVFSARSDAVMQGLSLRCTCDQRLALVVVQMHPPALLIQQDLCWLRTDPTQLAMCLDQVHQENKTRRCPRQTYTPTSEHSMCVEAARPCNG